MKSTNNVLVVGGGVAGLSAAETLADFGWQVLLIEQQGHLGGHSHHWACMATESCNRCSACSVCDRLRRVTSNPRIRIRTQARLVKLDGTDGAFKATIEPAESTETVCRSHPHLLLTAPESVSLAKVVIATGFTPFDPAELPMLNYERFGAVMTIADVDEYILQNRLSEFITDAEDRVAFIQCVGSRDRQRGRDYCSQFCCKASVRLARKLLFERPDLKITIYYIDLQVGGKEFRTFFEEMQGKVRFVQGTPAEILPAEEGPGLRVKAFNPDINQVGYETHDRIVLAVGQVAGPGPVGWPNGLTSRSALTDSWLSPNPGRVRSPAGPVSISPALAAVLRIQREVVFKQWRSPPRSDVQQTRSKPRVRFSQPGVTMPDKHKILVFIAANSAMQERLSTDRLVKEIADRGWVVSTSQADPPHDAIDALLESCRKHQPDGIVVAGPTSLLERVPGLIEVEGRTSVRPVPVNLVERCAFLHADNTEALSSAMRQIEVAAARSVSRQPIVFEERAQQRVVLVVGTGDSGARVADHLLSYGLQVVVLASDAETRTPMPEKAEVILSGRLQALSGFPGDFQAVIAQPNGMLIRRVGALVIAPEANRGRPPLPDDVLSDERVARLGEIAADDKGVGKGGIRSLAFLLDLGGPESRAVAAEVRRLALEAVDQGITVTVFYRHVAVHGRTGQLEYDKLRRTGVRMIRYDRAPVVKQQIRGLHIVGHDMILGEAEVEVTVDRLIVTDPLLPAPISGELAHLLNQPVDREGFLQPANVRHLPVGSPRKGVYFAGSGHQDLSENEARREAMAVSGQVAALLSGSTVLAPKALVIHDRESCAMCLTCLRSCYHGAISLSDDGGTVRFEPAACWECGICASVCPQKAITRLFSPEAELRAAVEAASKPIEDEAPVIAFLCQNSPLLALERAGRLGLHLPRQVVIIEVPCAGYISQSEVLAALSAGADRVVVAACHEDNCRSLHGSTSARDRSGQVMSDLRGLGLPHERVTFAGVAANEPYRLVDIITGVAAASNGKKEVANA